MRTTLTLDDDVAALIEAERRRTGESMREVVNRLLRRASRDHQPRREAPDLPVVPGRPLVDLTDTSALIAELDDADALEAHLQ
jgi:hypothetical protein